MWKPVCTLVSILVANHVAAGSAFTELEMQWLHAAAPVLEHAKQQRLPIDIIVQPQDEPGTPPLAMAFVDGRCKLVYSLRGNPLARTAFGDAPAALVPALIEAMTAHEVGHCWRYAHGAWHALPAGFVDADADTLDDEELARAQRDMRETRREEGYADLVGLAWTQRRYPQQYAQVHAWFTQLRANQPVPGSHHDTRTWVRLAASSTAFDVADTPFEQAWTLWQAGLAAER